MKYIDRTVQSDEEYEEEEEEVQEQPQVQIAAQYQTGIILQFGPITTATVRPTIETILNCHALSVRFDRFVIVINSIGGSLPDTFALIDVMLGSRLPVYTVGIGQICSGGLLVFVSGKKGHRILTPNTTIMSHQWSGVSVGKAHELLSDRVHQDMTTEMIVSHLKKHTKLTTKQIEKYLLPPNDVYLTAKEALKYGICDEVKEFGSAVGM